MTIFDMRRLYILERRQIIFQIGCSRYFRNSQVGVNSPGFSGEDDAKRRSFRVISMRRSFFVAKTFFYVVLDLFMLYLTLAICMDPSSIWMEKAEGALCTCVWCAS